MDEIAEAPTVGSREARKALAPIQRFLLGAPRYELMHWQLRRVLLGQFSMREQAAYRQKVLAWGQSYQGRQWPVEIPAYVLSHYAEHLREANQRDQLYSLINQSWMLAQFQHTFSYRAFAHDVDIALDAATAVQPPNVAQQVRLCLLGATLGAFATRIPPAALGALSWIGHHTSTEGFALLKQNGMDRGEAYYQIAAALLQKGDREEVFYAVAVGVPLLDAHGGAETIQDVYDRMMEI